MFPTLKTPLLIFIPTTFHRVPTRVLSSLQECLCVLILVSSEAVNALPSTLTPSDEQLNHLWSRFPFSALSFLAPLDHLNSRFSCAFPCRPGVLFLCLNSQSLSELQNLKAGC